MPPNFYLTKFLFVETGTNSVVLKLILLEKRMTKEESISESLIDSAVRVLLRVAFVFEPLAPTAITVLINQQLHRFKDSGKIGEYKTHTKRLGRYHYRIEIDLDLTGIQAIHLLGNLFPKQLSRFRRWFHD
jgi:hypothetical protein